MKAILVREFGGPEVLRLEEVPTPKPAAGQVLVRIYAAGVNPYDTFMRAGTYARATITIHSRIGWRRRRRGSWRRRQKSEAR